MFSSINSSAFGQYLKTLRKKLKITQAQVTEITGINPDTIRKIENGQVIPRYDTLAILSNIYKVDLVRKFTDYQSETTLMSFYSDLDRYLLNNDIEGIRQLKKNLENLDTNHTIFSNLLNKIELEQFKIYLTILELHMVDSKITHENALLPLQNAIMLTIPEFSAKNFSKLTYNTFELRLLILYAILWAKCDNFKLSNNILIFILDWLTFLFPDEQMTSHYKMKVHFNIAYNFHRLDLFELSLKHANYGIEIGQSKGLFNSLHALYYRKFTAELRLNHPEYKNSLRKCMLIMDILGTERLKEQYIQITKDLYGIDALALI